MDKPEVYAERAKSLFLSGYNCSQSVAGAFADLIGLDEKMLLKMVSPFGGGMGRLREVCGCVSGMFTVLGCLYGYDDPTVYDAKKELYARVQEVAGLFREANGSIICRELLGQKGQDTSAAPERRSEEYYKKRPCPQLAACAARILAEYIEEHPYD